MARCRLSDRKVRRKVRPLVPDEYIVAGAMVRGGWSHNIIMACLIDPEGHRRTATVDTATRECEVDGELSGWCFNDESRLAESIAVINRQP